MGGLLARMGRRRRLVGVWREPSSTATRQAVGSR
jgi:hypothetical protein